MEVLKNFFMKKIFNMFVVFTAVILLLTGISVYCFSKLTTANREDVYLIIKDNSSIENVSKLLQDKNVVKSKNIFLKYAKLNRVSNIIKGSNLIIRTGTSYKELISKLQNSQSDFYVVTIPEGFSLYQIGDIFEKNISVKKENILKVHIGDLTSNNIVSKGRNTYYDLEGFLYPDTYYIPVGANEKDVVNLMFSRFKNIISDKYINRAKELGLNINDVITIASLIEKESANDNERPRIAGVIYNRIKKKMPLQIDASVIYAVTKGKAAIEKVTYNDLKITDPYNTYIYKGLPPGPIASPGKASIEAALYPEKNDYLYYVANGKNHVFSKTYEEHLKNVKKYIK